MSNLRILNDLDRKLWSEFVYNHPQGNIFQTPRMFEVYQNTKHWEPVFLAVVDNNESVLGTLLCVIQKEFGSCFGRFSARAIIWGGPLVVSSENTEAIMQLLLDALDNLLQKQVIYVQFRNLWDFSEEKPYFINKGYTYNHHNNYQINLTLSQEQLLSNMSRNRRRNLHHALKNNLEIKEINDADNLEVFYRLLRYTYKKIKLPYPDLTFFQNSFFYLGNQKMVKFFLVLKEKKAIAGRALLIYKDRIYDWYAGSFPEAFTFNANEFLIWKILLWGKENNYKYFDFGGAGPADEDYGPGEYKRRFGGKAVNFGRFKKVYKKTLYYIIKQYFYLLKNKTI